MDEERPAGAPNLTPSEEMILDWIRAGLVDAEIAVRLGISTGEVRERIERLTSRMGVRDRAALRRLAPAPTEPAEPDPSEATELAPARWRLSPAVLLIVVLLGGATAFVASQSGEAPQDYGRRGDYLIEQELDRVYLDAADIVVLSDWFPSPTARPAPRTILRNGHGYLDTGRLLSVDGHPTGIASFEITQGRAHVTLAADQGLFRFDNGTAQWSEWVTGPTEREFTVKSGDRYYRLHIDRGDDETDFLVGDWDSMGIFSRGSGPPVITVWVEGRDVDIGLDGHLYIGVEPVD